MFCGVRIEFCFFKVWCFSYDVFDRIIVISQLCLVDQKSVFERKMETSPNGSDFLFEFLVSFPKEKGCKLNIMLSFFSFSFFLFWISNSNNRILLAHKKKKKKYIFGLIFLLILNSIYSCFWIRKICLRRLK